MDPAAPSPRDHNVLTMQADHKRSVLWDVQGCLAHIYLMNCLNFNDFV